MKSFFDSKPNSIESLGNGKFHVYWNIEAYVHEGDNERTEGWQADYLEVDKASYDNIVDKLIKRQYSVTTNQPNGLSILTIAKNASK